MNPRMRIVFLLAAVLTLVVLLVRTNLPVTQAEKPPIEKSSLSQGFTNLAGDSTCNGQHLQVNITAGDFPILIDGTGTDLPRTVNAPGMQYLVGPGSWTGLTLTEQSGDGEVLALPDVTCTLPPNNLQATMTCDNGDLVVEILSGDPFFAIIGTGPGLPFSTMETGVYRFPGPAVWINLNVHEPVGDDIIRFGTLDCRTTTPPETPEPPTETPVPPPAPIVLPDYVPAVVMQLSGVTPQIVYDAPAGQPIYQPDGSLLMLPHDADASGADTYLILDAEMVEGEAWVGVYLGGPQLGWLPLASLTLSVE